MWIINVAKSFPRIHFKVKQCQRSKNSKVLFFKLIGQFLIEKKHNIDIRYHILYCKIRHLSEIDLIYQIISML